MAYQGWINIFPYYTNAHLPRLTSDHNSILLEFHSDLHQKDSRRQKAKPKRFEKIWMETLKIDKVIEQIWNDHYTTNTIGKLHLTLDNLWHWGKKEFGSPSTEIKRIKEVIQALQIDNQHNKNYKTIKRI